MPLRTDCVFVYVFRRCGESWEVLQLRRAPDRFMGDTWQFVSGGIEPGETAADAALRELREETGLVPSEFYHGDFVKTFHLPGRDETWLCPTFVAIVENDVIKLNAEHVDARWVALGRAEPMWSDDRRALEVAERQVLHDSAAKAYLRLPLP